MVEKKPRTKRLLGEGPSVRLTKWDSEQESYLLFVMAYGDVLCVCVMVFCDAFTWNGHQWEIHSGALYHSIHIFNSFGIVILEISH